MSAQSQYEREEESIAQAEADGLISKQEMWKQLTDLQRDYRAQAEEAAQEAYENELRNW